jgi:hypothetical protein
MKPIVNYQSYHSEKNDAAERGFYFPGEEMAQR